MSLSIPRFSPFLLKAEYSLFSCSLSLLPYTSSLSSPFGGVVFLKPELSFQALVFLF